MKFSSQKGFTLLEVSIASAIAALGIMATLQMREIQAQIDTARSVAQVYERLNNAAGSYLTLYYKDIVNKFKVSPNCGAPAYEIPTDGKFTAVNHGSDCKIELTVNGKSQTVNNYLQPKPSELAKLGLLTASDGRYEDNLPLPSFALAGGSASTSMVVYNTSLDSTFGTVNSQARNGMAILISLSCMNSGCSTYEMRSLVYNIQPYSNLNDNSSLLYRVMQASGGGRTYLSDTRFGGELRSDGGVSTLANPIKMRNTTDGPPFILAMQNGYASEGLDAFVRRDGSTPLTSDWNVGNQSITGINNLDAGTATVTGEINAGSVSAGSVYGNSVSGLTGVFGDFLGAVRAALNATTAYFSGDVTTDGDLTVAGATKINSDLTVAGASKLNSNLSVAGNTVLAGGTKVADFRLENEAVFGGTCDPSTQTLARASSSSADYGNNLRLLVCDPNSKKWTRPQADYNSQIQNLAGNLGVVSGNVDSLTTLTEQLKNRKVYVEYFDIQWDPANFKGTEEYTERGEKKTREVWETELWRSDYGGRTWKPTPWVCNPSDRNTREANNSSSFNYASSGPIYPPFTPPMLFSLDGGADADQTVVYDVGCIDRFNTITNPPVWHVAVGQKQRNISGGNNCGSGLSSNLNEFAWKTNQGQVNGGFNYYDNGEKCRLFNIRTPNFNSVEIKARFMVFFKKD